MQKMKILLADDLSAIRNLVRKILLEEYPSGLIEEVADGRELVKRVINHPWDLVITDISMPEMTGLEAIKEIRRLSFILPVLVLSSHTEDKYIQFSLQAGASGYVHKYKIRQDLGNAIRELQESRTGLSYMNRQH